MTTDDERDARVSARYRELGGDAPPARLDDAILAASRRAVHARPGSPGTSSVRRWAVPFSVAAAVILSVMVTVHVQDERPDLASPPPVAPPAPRAAEAPADRKDAPVAASEQQAPVAPAPAAAPKPSAARQVPAPVITPGAPLGALGTSAEPARAPAPQADGPQSATRDDSRPPPGFAEAPRSAAVVPAPQPALSSAPAPAPAAAPPKLRALADANVAGASAPAPAEIRQRGELARDRMASAAEDAVAKRTIEEVSPERQLERIAALRADGRHAEADKLLAEFRQRHPTYRITDEMLKRVERAR